MSKTRLFIGYKRGAQPDEASALLVHEKLEQEHDVFIDQEMHVGERWPERIQEELRDVGDLDILTVDTPEYLVAKGALKLAQVMPDDQFSLVE